MARFLLILLILSGLASLAVVANPHWVVFGLFFGILPGLFMAVLPGLFLFLLGFAVFWRLIRGRVRGWPAIPLALLLAAGLFFAIGIAAQGDGPARFAAATAAVPDVRPDSKLVLAGDIRLSVPSPDVDGPPPEVVADYQRRLTAFERRKADWLAREKAEAQRQPPPCSPQPCQVNRVIGFPEERPVYADYPRRWRCDGLCTELLATPGVTSVTVDGHGERDQPPTGLSSRATTFRLGDDAVCQAPGAVFEAPERCIVASAALRSAPALTILWLRHWQPNRPVRAESGWSFDAEPMRIERLLILDARGGPLLRQSRVELSVIRAPLMILYEGRRRADFGWSRTRLTNRPRFDDFRPEILLGEWTSFGSAAGNWREMTPPPGI